MTILVKIHSEVSKKPFDEWAIVELQGNLKPIRTSDLNKKCFGNLHYNKNGIPTLIVGHHILQGREEMLVKPFAVLKKTDSDVENAVSNGYMKNCTVSLDNTLFNKTVALENNINQRTHYFIEAICTKKLIFKIRPKPIIMNVPKKK